LIDDRVEAKKRAEAVEALNRHDITDLSQAVVVFESQFNMDYVPSRLVICETLNDYQTGMTDSDPATAQLYSDSFNYLCRLCPRINFTTVQPGTPDWQGIDWNGNGVQDPPVILEGDQCLVFFLGGIQSNKEGKLECLGFSVNQANPARGGGQRVGPFCEFKSSRLRASPNGYYVYLDAYGKAPFAYFSSYKTRNGYNRYRNSDCGSIPDGPYHDGDGQYYNPDSFQIISAGADGKFGRGGKWTPAKAAEIDPDGRDDMSNFHTTLLLLGNAR
jgi:general secretion pathway protein G